MMKCINCNKKAEYTYDGESYCKKCKNNAVKLNLESERRIEKMWDGFYREYRDEIPDVRKIKTPEEADKMIKQMEEDARREDHNAFTFAIIFALTFCLWLFLNIYCSIAFLLIVGIMYLTGKLKNS